MNRWECQNCGASGPLIDVKTCPSCGSPKIVSQWPIEPKAWLKSRQKPKIPDEIKNNPYLVARWICEKW